MIRNIIERTVANKLYVEATGLSTDTKQTEGIINGTITLADGDNYNGSTATVGITVTEE